MVSTMGIPADVMIKSVTQSLAESRTSGALDFAEATGEAETCHFLYAFLAYSYDWYNREARPEVVAATKRKVWDTATVLFTYDLRPQSM